MTNGHLHFDEWPAATNVVALRPHQSKGVKRILVHKSAFVNPLLSRRKMMKNA
ncbi:hypothetical protein ABIS04_11370 [Shewanella sp. H8]|uniref:hypothetical protein n=1 Tax=Shewanella sp. H8 TaxID=3342676 RepID=UPI003315C555